MEIMDPLTNPFEKPYLSNWCSLGAWTKEVADKTYIQREERIP